MRREDLVDLAAFVAVAEEQSFTRAAAKLGTSQSTLSHTMKRLEARHGVRLLTRTTRNVAPTAAGERLLKKLHPAFQDIDDELASLRDLSDKPAGTIRISTSEHAARTLIWPALEKLLPDYPDLEVEISVDNALTDIVSERFDAGVRLGERIEKDMIAVRIGPDMRMAVVASPSYLKAHGRPRTPQDLSRHRCINLRLPTSGGLFAWDLEKGKRELHVRVDGQITVNHTPLAVRAAAAGLGIAYVIEDQASDELANGQVQRVLEDWCEPFAGYHLYYPSRRQSSAAFNVLISALRYRN